MNFPKNYGPANNRGSTPIIGEQTAPAVVFQIQVTPEMMTALSQYAEMSGLDGGGEPYNAPSKLPLRTVTT